MAGGLDEKAAIGGAIGGALGAYIGSEMNGRDGAIIGGAVGNLIDRAVYGHVVDYILFHTETWSFAVFNLADSFISLGAGLIVLDELISTMKDRKSRK